MSNLTIQTLNRVFTYNGLQLPDPGQALSPAAVCDLYSATYPEILSATVVGPKFEGDTVVYEFVRAVRDKG